MYFELYKQNTFWLVCGVFLFKDLQTLGRNEEANIKDNVEHMRQVLGENSKAMASMVLAIKSMQVSKQN